MRIVFLHNGRTDTEYCHLFEPLPNSKPEIALVKLAARPLLHTGVTGGPMLKLQPLFAQNILALHRFIQHLKAQT
jgi:hypothetical protein